MAAGSILDWLNPTHMCGRYWYIMFNWNYRTIWNGSYLWTNILLLDVSRDYIQNDTCTCTGNCFRADGAHL